MFHKSSIILIERILTYLKSCIFISGQNMWLKWKFGVFLKKMKSPETRGFLSIGTLFDRWVSAKNKGEWRKLFAFAIFCALFYADSEIISEHCVVFSSLSATLSHSPMSR